MFLGAYEPCCVLAGSCRIGEAPIPGGGTPRSTRYHDYDPYHPRNYNLH